MNLEQRLEALRREIDQVEPDEARDLQRGGAALIDVREAAEVAGGLAEGATSISHGDLEGRIGEAVPDRDCTVLLMCGGGRRSLLSAGELRRLGYSDVRSVAGGFERWKTRGLPCTPPDSAAGERYVRQVVLPELGPEGQRRLGEARVLVVGAGGLGSPAALYLAGAGVGTLGLVDADDVERSNLHRQVLHTDDRVGEAKTESARAALNALNPDVTVRAHRERLTEENADSILSGYDLVLDGSDNFPTRYLVSDTCRRLGVTEIYGAVQGFEGQVSVFRPGAGPCYRCLFPRPPESAPTCSDAGVLGPVPGIIGLLQALEALKLIVGFGEPLVGRLLRFNAGTSRMRETKLPRDPACACSGTDRP